MFRIPNIPLKQALRCIKGEKVSAIQEWFEDRYYDILCSPRRARYWFLSTFTKTKIKVKSLHGGYHDTDTLIFYTNFQLLVDFMEIEVAHMWDICLAKYEPAKHLKPKTKREKAIAYYTWTDDMTGMSPQEKRHYKAQKKEEQKVVDLYLWWVDERPARKDKWEELVKWEHETGFQPSHFEPCDNNCSTMVHHTSHPLWPEYDRLRDAARKQDDEWEKEDTQKLIELIKIRRRLWT